MVGYSRLMEADESGTLARLKTHRIELIDPAIAKHNGRIVKTTGDGMLVEFASVADAVQCAAEIQRRMAKRNADVPEDRRIDFRIGINLGDIIVEDDDVYGGGVNIAARLEALAEPGGICISGTAYDNLTAKIDVGYEDLGAQDVKNITKPVHVYRVLLEAGDSSAAPASTLARRRRWAAAMAAVVVLLVGAGAGYWSWENWWRSQRVEAASVERMALPLPERPSIAVVPLQNLSPALESAVFVDALSERLIATLTYLPGAFVIAAETSLQLHGDDTGVRNVAEQLGVQYVLKGSYQRTDDKFRVTVQLVNAIDGRLYWSSEHNHDLSDLFAYQGEVVLAVASTLDIILTEAQRSRFSRLPTRSLAAWEIGLDAHSLQQVGNREANLNARERWLQASQLDPDFMLAWLQIGWTHWADARFSWTDNPQQSLREARQNAEHVLQLDPANADAYALLGNTALIEGNHERAIVYGRRSITLNPNNADNWAKFAVAQYFSGEPLEAENSVKEAMRLNPYYPHWYLVPLQEAYRLSGRNELAIETIQEQLGRSNHYLARLRLALYYMKAGSEGLARDEIRRVLEERSDLTLNHWTRAQYFRDEQVTKDDVSALSSAGLSEHVNFDCLMRGECG